MESKEHKALLFKDIGDIRDYFGEDVYLQHERLEIASAGQTVHHRFNTMPNYEKIVGIALGSNQSWFISLISEFGLKVNSNEIFLEGTPISVLFTTPSSGSLLERISDLIYADADGSVVDINYKDKSSSGGYTVDFLFILKGRTNG